MEIKSTKFQTILILICTGIFSRLIPHQPNFTAVIATGVFAGFYLNHFKYSIPLVILVMVLSDLFLGFYNLMPFTYLALCVPILLGHMAKKHPSVKGVFCSSFISSVSFFTITNFAVWGYTSLYPKTLSGLFFCYAAAIPFFINQIAGDLFYTAAIFGTFFALKKRFQILNQN